MTNHELHLIKMKQRLAYSRYSGPIIVSLIILLANSIYLLHFTNPNPINTQSGLAVSSSHLVTGYDVIDPNDGLTTQTLGHAGAENILHGHMPWWNYNEQVGAPLAAEMQSAVFFPLTLLLALSTGLLYFHIILEIVAGVATYLLLRKLGLRKITAITFGAAFGLNGAFAWFGSPNFNPIAFMPLLILGVETAYENAVNNKKRGWLLIAIALALSLYAGFPEEAYIDGLLACLWIAVRIFQLRRSVWKKFLIKTVIGGIVGLLLAAPILIIFLGYLHSAYLGDHSGAVASTSLYYLSIPMLLLPYIYGTVYGVSQYDPTGRLGVIWGNVGGYVTLSIVLFIGLAAFGKNRRVLKIALILWIAALAARIYGLVGFSHIFNLIPGISKIAIYRYGEPSLEFAAIILGALGFDRMFEIKKSIKKEVAASSTVLLLICTVLIVVAHKQLDLLKTAPHHELMFVATLVWGLGTTAIIAITLITNFKYRMLFCSFVITADFVLMFAIPELSAPRTIQINTTPVSFLQKHEGTYRMFTLGPIQPNYGTYYGIDSIDTNNLPLPQKWASYIHKSLDPAANQAAFLGVDPPIPDSLSPKDIFLKNIANYEYVGVKYLVTFPDTYTTNEIQQADLKQVFSTNVATIYQLPHPQPYFSIIEGECHIVSSSGKSKVTVDCTKPGKLLRRELYSTGWSAKTANTNLAISQTGPLFQSIEIPAGVHTISFNYLPPHIVEGFILFILGLVSAAFIYAKPSFQKSADKFKDTHSKRNKKIPTKSHKKH